MSRGTPWLAGILALAVIASAIGVVYSKFLSRKHFVQLQALRVERDRADILWGRLQLEESALAAYSRVSDAAQAKLGMDVPEPSRVLVIQTR